MLETPARPVLGPGDFAPPSGELIPDPELGDEPFEDEELEDEGAGEEPEAEEPEDEGEAEEPETAEVETAEAETGEAETAEAETAEAEAPATGGPPARGGPSPAPGTIVSRKNPRLRTVRALLTRRGRRRESKFVIEGVKVVREFLARAVPVEQVLYRAGVDERADVRAILDSARARSIQVHAVDPSLWGSIATTETSQGVLAIAPLGWRPLDDVLGPFPGDPDAAPPRAVAVAVGVQDPGNLGAILRSARFLGFSGVACLSGTTDPWAPKVVRASSGALIESPPARVDSLAALADAAKGRAMKLVALVAHGGRPLGEAPLPRRSVLLLGAEGPGLPDAALGIADERITIPAADPAAESLNAAMAFAIAAWAWRSAWAGKSGH
jgi:TrmH family RNA methyltransferase